MNYLERSVSDTGFIKIAKKDPVASPNYGRMAYNVAAAPFRIGSKIYNSVGDRAQNHMLAGGGLFAAGAIGAPYAGEAYHRATDRVSRLGGKRYSYLRGKNVYKSPLRQRFRAGKKLMLAGLATKGAIDYADAIQKGRVTSADGLVGAGMAAAGGLAGMRLLGRRGAGIGAAIGLGTKILNDYRTNKV
jgi:hypothetical protein